MNRLLLGLMLLVTATAASAAWKEILDNDAHTTYIDLSTIRNGRGVCAGDGISRLQNSTESRRNGATPVNDIPHRIRRGY